MKNFLIICSAGILFLTSCQSPSSNNQPETTAPAAAAATAAPVETGITNTHWKLIELNGQPVTNPPSNQKEAYIMFQDSNKLVGNTGCNQLIGQYELTEGNRVRFSGIGTTLMACPDVAIEQEMGRSLSMMDNYSINGNQMTLQKAKMAPMFRFEAVQN
jgi:heat shock protein HslJ